ncbi:hypothetical protein H5410_047962 [Solanum commersonii]|uniref:F-box family protein n=1 Tax=Solanum commersonii TaxID=4109 RepID=A0A9J5XKI8_SOLCO|nr:hypothetical protein H5410_047962 [Solanum commersonii]
MFESTERLEWKVEKRDEELITEFSSSTEVEEQVPKVCMNNYMTIKRETADILPECVIRKILCFLSFKESAQLSILSKTWLQAWLTHPNLDVIVDYYGNNLDIVDNIMKRYRDGIIPIEKFELSYFDSTSQGFPLIDKWFDIALQNGVKDLAFNVPKYSSYRLPIFKILATKSLRELVMWGCHLKRASLTSGVVNCNSLRLLSLSSVTLSEKMLKTLLNSCPLIVSFICDYCDGLEKIELVNLQNIKSISIWKGRKQRVKIQAPTLEHLSYFSFPKESSMLDMLDVPNLVSLEYKGDQIPETFVDANFQWSCYPKRLILESTSKTIASFMDRLMYMKSLSHSTTNESKSLHSQLKEVKVYKLDSSWQLVEFRSEERATRILKEGEKFYFTLDGDVVHSISDIQNDSKELDVIPNVGMGELLYNNEIIASHFDVRAWYNISQTYNRRELLQDNFSQVTGFKIKVDEKLKRIAPSDNLGSMRLKTMHLSYDNLPDYFKPCLIYMGMFPENHIISASKLTNLWIAEGFVQNVEFGRLEEAAEGYLMDLISSNVVMA